MAQCKHSVPGSKCIQTRQDSDPVSQSGTVSACQTLWADVCYLGALCVLRLVVDRLLMFWTSRQQMMEMTKLGQSHTVANLENAVCKDIRPFIPCEWNLMWASTLCMQLPWILYITRCFPSGSRACVRPHMHTHTCPRARARVLTHTQKFFADSLCSFVNQWDSCLNVSGDFFITVGTPAPVSIIKCLSVVHGSNWEGCRRAAVVLF
jgi:hypothetical protein